MCHCAATYISVHVLVSPHQAAMAFPRSRPFAKKPFRKAAPRRPVKRRATTRPASFAAEVKKANLSSAQQKNVSVCFMEHKLHHNRWYKGILHTWGDRIVSPQVWRMVSIFSRICAVGFV